MSRWEPNARGRLAQAALELFGEHGFEQTTAAGIAQRAGLTERTFFRYFTDKREVLFLGSTTLKEYVVTSVAGQPGDMAPIDVVVTAMAAAAGNLLADHGHARRRQAVITANRELQERELLKLASIAEATAEALRGRGVPEPAATLAAEAGTAVFRTAFNRWVADPTPPADLPHLVRDSLAQLRTVTAAH
jgi:AcrR family transcriptional regulator